MHYLNEINYYYITTRQLGTYLYYVFVFSMSITYPIDDNIVNIILRIESFGNILKEKLIYFP